MHTLQVLEHLTKLGSSQLANVHEYRICSPGARFSKVPKLYGLFPGVTIPFLSQERRGFKSSNFTVIFPFVTLKSC